MGVVQHREEREEEQCIAEAYETEEEGHVELERRTAQGRAFQRDGVGTVDDGGEEGERVAKEELGGGFGRKWVCNRRNSRGGRSFSRGTPWSSEVSVGDKDDANEGGKDAEELAEGESLSVGAGADEERPDRGGRGEDRGGSDGGVLEAGHGEVVGGEPEDTECKGQASRWDEPKVDLWT